MVIVRKRKDETESVCFFDNGYIVTVTKDPKGNYSALFIPFNHVLTAREYEPVQIGSKTIEDSGFEITGPFNGMSENATLFIGIENGPLYDEFKRMLLEKVPAFQK